MIPINNRYYYHSGAKMTVSCYRDFLNEKPKEKLKREEMEDSYQLSTDWFVIMIPKDGGAILVTVAPNKTGRSRNVFVGFKAETECKINIIQR